MTCLKIGMMRLTHLLRLRSWNVSKVALFLSKWYTYIRLSLVVATEKPWERDSQFRRTTDESRRREDGNFLQESFTLLMIATNDIPKVIGGRSTKVVVFSL